eukprot:TRINITY_DN2729_c0_g1_i3.p1 TRINITY_DN2729_c0_g1~~TRINITY_DN2729_c0_g1_i3.p1  ORF type:complete len:121 (-),score=17.46 TRINITY_DN2729_c0_g1_i3:266-628(-)
MKRKNRDDDDEQEEVYTRPAKKTIKNDKKFIYAKTLDMLMSDSVRRSAAPIEKRSDSMIIDYINSSAKSTDTMCYVCQKQAYAVPCSYCAHYTCESCLSQCHRCSDVFCKFCCTIKYVSF